eukprot:gene16321-43761_t
MAESRWANITIGAPGTRAGDHLFRDANFTACSVVPPHSAAAMTMALPGVAGAMVSTATGR